MTNQFIGDGNLGDAPTLKRVQVKGDDRSVAEMRVFFDEYRSDGQGGYEQSGGFWLSISVWDKLADQVAEHLRKGCRVRVEGRLQWSTWTDEHGEEAAGFSLIADSVTLKLARVESVSFKPKRTVEESSTV